MAKAQIFLVEADPTWAELLADLLLADAYDVLTAHSQVEAITLLQSHRADVVIADVNTAGGDGTQFIEQLRQLFPFTALIVHTGQPNVPQAVAAIRLGALDYLEKSRDIAAIQKLRNRVAEAARTRSTPPPSVRVSGVTAGALIGNAPVEGFYGIISQDPRMRDVFELIQTIADSYANVLIQGETGTGKELVARAIHEASERHHKPFVTVDCSTLARELMESELFGHEKGAFTGATDRRIGRFERANGGTLFLDEVANIAMETQAKLLRVIQSRSFERVGGQRPIFVNVRIIAASNCRLEDCVKQGTFREDLFHRVNVVQIDLPPLRERPADIPLLAGEFLRRFARQNGRDVRGFTDTAVRALCGYRWPGNVRELENVVLQAVVLAKAPFLDFADLPRRITQSLHEPPSPSLVNQLGEPEKEILLKALRQHGGNIKRAAAMLEISRTTLYAKLKKHGVDPDAIR